jgi:hypothetical protein
VDTNREIASAIRRTPRLLVGQVAAAVEGRMHDEDRSVGEVLRFHPNVESLKAREEAADAQPEGDHRPGPPPLLFLGEVRGEIRPHVVGGRETRRAIGQAAAALLSTEGWEALTAARTRFSSRRPSLPPDGR